MVGDGFVAERAQILFAVSALAQRFTIALARAQFPQLYELWHGPKFDDVVIDIVDEDQPVGE